MNRDSLYQRTDHSRGSVDVDLLKPSSPGKKRKTGGFRVIVRKLFGRKSVKSQISLPTPARNFDNDPSAFITTARAVSLPAREISRRSALGSHSPSVPTSYPTRRDNTSEKPKPAFTRPRGSSLPGLLINSPDSVPLPAAEAHSEERPRTGQIKNNGNIGFAVTSGSNPKRRSRSADAFFDASRGHRMSPIQWRQWRRRSDEIKYWRDSIAESPALASNYDDRDILAEEETQEDPQTVDHKIPDQTSLENRDTFDFGVLATSMQEQETISIEERIVTLEVKLMDLEYAISKIQAQPPSPPGLSPQHLRRTLRVRKPSVESELSGTSSPPKVMEQSHDSSVASPSTQPTSQSSYDSHHDRKPRPVSNAPTIRAPRNPSPGVTEQGTKKARNRLSITSMTIDHYTTLIGLIRREQAARIRLEDQVTELQRQVMNLQYPSPPQSRTRIPRWKGTTFLQGSTEALDSVGGRSAFDNDDTDTEDGYQETYETPTERREFEGAIFGSPFEGEAF